MSRWAFIVLVLLSCGLFLQLGTQGYISDSEIWSVTLGRHILSEWYHPWVATRPLFYGLLALAEAPFRGSVPIFLAAKFVSLANAVLLLFLTYRLSRALTDSSEKSAFWVPWASVLILVTHPAFLNQGYRIRSDLFACSLVLFALERTIALEKRNIVPTSRDRLMTASLWLLPMLATPKAALQILTGLPFLRALHPFSSLSPKKRGMIYASLLLILIALAPLYWGSFEYFIWSFRAGKTSIHPSDYWSSWGFYFLRHLIVNNPLFTGLIVIRLICLGARLVTPSGFKEEKDRRLHLRFLSLVVLDALVAVFAPERYPFLLASLLPTVAIFGAMILEDLEVLQHSLSSIGKRAKLWRVIILACYPLLLLGFISNGWAWYRSCLAHDTTGDEFTLIHYLENYVHRFPKAVYYDGIGTLPLLAKKRYFVGPNDTPAINDALDWVHHHPPDLIFYTNKMTLLEPEIGQILKSDYRRLDQGVFGHWEVLRKPLKWNLFSLHTLQERIEKIRHRVGASDSQSASLEIVFPDGRKKILDSTVRPPRRDSGGKVERICIFPILPDPPPLQVQQVIRFDSEY